MSDESSTVVPAEGTARRWPRTRIAAAVGAGIVLFTATAGYAAVSRYTGEVRQRDVFGTLAESARPADDAGTTILLVGLDTRAGLTDGQKDELHVGKGHYGRARADTVMLVHISPGERGITVVSLPRDSYLDIPAYTDANGGRHPARKDRLSAAYEIGQAPMLVNTVEQATGVHVDHYAEVDFMGFLTMVDALGGVDVCLPKPVVDKRAGLNLPAGTSTVSGTEALGFVRARAIDSEFGRMARQQAFLASIVQKASSAGTLLNPVAVNSFLDAATSAITTDSEFSRNDMLGLADRLRGVAQSDITFLTVPVANKDYRVDIGKTKNQSTVLWAPEAKDLFAHLREDLPLNGAPVEDGPTAVRVAPERVRIKVFNATPSQGLGKRVADELTAAGYQIMGQPQNAKPIAGGTTVIQYDPAFDESLKTLRAALPNAAVKPVNGLGNTFLILVGTDYAGVKPVTVSATASGPSNAITSPTKVRNAAMPICE